MRLPFKGSYRLTQKFGENPQSYAQFGYKGHNGLDHGVPTGTDLFAMITGTVIEARMDTTGYGNYVKIENDKEGALVGHMQTLAVKPGDKVVEGETFIGKSNNTGNSTGPHTHTGYFIKPRDRSNGYGGYIDFSHLLDTPMATISIDTAVFEKLVANSTKYDEFVAAGYTSPAQVKEQILKLEQDLQACHSANDENIQDEKELLAELEETRETVSTQVQKIAKLEDENKSLVEQVNSQTLSISELKKEIADLKLQLSAIPQTPDMTPTVGNLLSMLRLIIKNWLA